ncbi:MAG: hypothetical protein HQK50_03895 [Oligoflexia bacterium]|nr:hypothetical protein [Oligoflexia bacterium]MBF0364686.1 hypothetical protein [Oligoflexia bacterium]
MNLRIHNLSHAAINSMLFLLISLFYFHTAIVIQNNMTAIHLTPLIDFLNNHLPLIALIAITIISIAKAKKISVLLLAITLAIFTALLANLVFEKFGRIVFLMCSSYAIFAFTCLSFWWVEIKKAIYNPKFLEGTLFSRPPITISITIAAATTRSNSNSTALPMHQGILSNWDAYSAFALLDADIPKDLLGKKIIFTAVFKEVSFQNLGWIVTSCPSIKGVGITFPRKQTFFRSVLDDSQKNWQTLYTHLIDMAYLPEFWK